MFEGESLPEREKGGHVPIGLHLLSFVGRLEGIVVRGGFARGEFGGQIIDFVVSDD